jgi:predicted Rossmann-fold nucleotide-binding protein
MMEKIPIYLFGSSFWNRLVSWLKDEVKKVNVIDDSHLELFTIEDDITKMAQEVISHI